MSVVGDDASTVWVVVGPTASGKSELAMQLSRVVGGEIIGADSVHVYRGFDIGSNKPTEEEQRRVRHHLIDVADPLEPMDAAMYAGLADRSLAEVRERGKVPIVCGGTFLWVRALLYGLAAAPAGDPARRERHAAEAAERGRAALHARLSEVDPASAARLSPNDLVRVSRALEVWEMTGKPMSVWQAEHGFAKPRHRARLVGVEWSPEELTARI